MSSTDDRIVKMQFDNKQFMQGAKESKTALDNVNAAVDKSGNNKGLLNLGNQATVAGGKLKAMSIIGVTALATIANKAVNVGLNVVKSLTFDPVKMGFDLYESELTKLNTIMNATGKSRGTVQTALNNLNNYANKTIYKFSDMTTSLTKFVNAGLGLQKSVKLTKDFANMVAFAGGSAQDASAGFYALTQMEQLGFVQLQDFKQFDNASLATTKFKQALIDAAVAQGTLVKNGDKYITQKGHEVSATGNFNQTLQDQWATTKVLNTAISSYGDLSTAMGRKAFAAAQNVRTFSAFMDQLKEQMATGWSRIFRGLFGNLNQSTKLWTSLSNVLGNAIFQFFSFAEVVLYAWRRLGGFQKVMEGFKNILAPFGAIITVVATAFRAAFPPGRNGVGKGLYDLSAGFAAVTSPLALLAKLIKATQPVVTGFFLALRASFAVFGLIEHGIATLIQAIASFFKLKAPKAGGFVHYVKTLADNVNGAISQFVALLDTGKSVSQALGNLDFKLPKMPKLDLGSVGGAAKAASSAVSGKLQGLDFKSLLSGFKQVGDGSKNVDKAGVSLDLAKRRLEAFGRGVQAVGHWLSFLGHNFINSFKGLPEAIKGAFKNFDGEKLMASFNTAIFATTAINLNKLIHTFTGFGEAMRQFAKLGSSFAHVTKGAGAALESFQTQAKAKLILNIAIAIGILAVSLAILAFIPADKLTRALVAMGTAMAEMAGFAKVMVDVVNKMDGKGVTIKLGALSASLVLLGLSLLLLSAAFLIMNKVKLSSVVKGLATVYVVMQSFVKVGDLAEKAYKNILAAGVAMAAISGSLILVAGALLLFNFVKWGSMAKAGVAIAGLALALGVLAKIKDSQIAKVGLALLVASAGLNYMAIALISMGHVKWASLAKAAVILILLVGSLVILSKVGGVEATAAFVGLAAAMVLMAGAGLILNKVNWSSLLKLAAILILITAAFAGFMAIVSFFAPALILLGAFVGSLALLAGALALLAASFAIVVPLLGVGVTAFTAFATAAAVGIAVFIQTLAQEAPVIAKSILAMLQVFINTIIAAVPMIINGIDRLIKAVVKALKNPDGGKGAGDGAQSMISKFADKVKEWIPKIVDKAVQLVKGFLKGLVSHASEIAGEGAKFVIGLINGIGKHVGQLVAAGVNVIVSFIKGLGQGGVQIAAAALSTIVKFLHGLTAAVKIYSPQIRSAAKGLAFAIIDGITGGLGSRAQIAYNKISEIMNHIISIAKKIPIIHSPSRVFMDIGAFLVQGLTNGIQNNAAAAIGAVASMMTGAIATAGRYLDAGIRDLDQKTTAAVGRAAGLALAAQKAAALADKTKKNKKDDKQAKLLGREATKAQAQADAAQAASDAAHDAADRADQFNKASTIDKAKMRSEDAQNQLDAARAAEQQAEADRTAAAALKAQARKRGISKAEAKKLNDQAAALLKQAQAQANAANAAIAASQVSAGQALALQQQAGAEAAAAFQAAYDADAKAAADAEAFDKLSDSDKAIQRRKDAEALQAKADADLAKAKQLAYSDLDAANDLAQQSIDEADQARQYLKDAQDYENSAGTATGVGGGAVVNVDPTEAAALAFNSYRDTYDAATAAAAAQQVVEFNQYNTSPEALSASEIYRQSNNLLNYAADKLQPAEAA